MRASFLCPACSAQDAAPAGGYPARSGSLFSGRELKSCAACGLVFVSPMPAREELDAYYESSYWLGDVASINPETQAYYLAQCRARLDFLRLDAAALGSVLDIGAGSGAMYRALKERGFSGVYDAVEPDAKQAEAIASWKAGEVRRRLGDPGRQDYDLIVLAHVLEHVPAPGGFLKEIAGFLAPEGELFIEVPNGDHEYKAELEPHVLFFSERSLRGLLSRIGRMGPVSVCGKPRAQLRERFAAEKAARGGLKSLLPASVKLGIKKLLGRDKPPSADVLRGKFDLDARGEDRQWLRAVMRRPTASP